MIDSLASFIDSGWCSYHFSPFIIILLTSFSHQRYLIVFHWSLCDSKYLQIGTLFSIPIDLNNAVMWIVSIHPPISNSAIPLSKQLETFPSALVSPLPYFPMFSNFSGKGLGNLSGSQNLRKFYASRSRGWILIFILHSFASFAYNVINRFVFVSSCPTLAILLPLINFRFNIIGPYDVVLFCCFSFSLKVTLFVVMSSSSRV